MEGERAKASNVDFSGRTLVDNVGVGEYSEVPRNEQVGAKQLCSNTSHIWDNRTRIWKKVPLVCKTNWPMWVSE